MGCLCQNLSTLPSVLEPPLLDIFRLNLILVCLHPKLNFEKCKLNTDCRYFDEILKDIPHIP